MRKQMIFLLIAVLSLPTLPADVLSAHAWPAVLLKKAPTGYVLSVHACGETLEKLLRIVGTQCRIEIAVRGEQQRLSPVRIHFNDLPLERALKKLLKAAGITNYLIRYSDRDNSPQSITKIIIFSNGPMTGAVSSSAATVTGEKQDALSDDREPPAAERDSHSYRIASLKDRYLWENEETSTWAMYLLEAMPDEAKDVGLDCIIKELDNSSGTERTAPLNAALFYRAIEAAAPPDIAPVMMQQVRRLSEQYYNSRAQENADTSSDGFPHNPMSREGR